MEKAERDILFFSCIHFTKPEDTQEFGGFKNAVLEYVFQLSHEVRGSVDRVVVYYGRKYDREMQFVGRFARIHVQKDDNRYFFYVLAKASVHALQEWQIVGRSSLLSGPIRTPDADEMIWFMEGGVLSVKPWRPQGGRLHRKP